MSRAALASCRTALEMIATVTTEDTVLRLTQRALQGLNELEKLEADKREREAKRKRDERAVRGRPPDVRGHPRESGAVRGGGEGGGLSSDLQDTTEETPPLSLTGGSGGSPQPSSDVQGRPRTQDFMRLGRADEWLSGMREATGNAGWTRQAEAVGTMKLLEGVLAAMAPAEGDLEWAREIAIEYARANQGALLSVFAFKAWLQSDKPARGTRGPLRATGTPAPSSPKFELLPIEEKRLADARGGSR